MLLFRGRPRNQAGLEACPTGLFGSSEKRGGGVDGKIIEVAAALSRFFCNRWVIVERAGRLHGLNSGGGDAPGTRQAWRPALRCYSVAVRRAAVASMAQ